MLRVRRVCRPGRISARLPAPIRRRPAARADRAAQRGMPAADQQPSYYGLSQPCRLVIVVSWKSNRAGRSGRTVDCGGHVARASRSLDGSAAAEHGEGDPRCRARRRTSASIPEKPCRRSSGSARSTQNGVKVDRKQRRRESTGQRKKGGTDMGRARSRPGHPAWCRCRRRNRTRNHLDSQHLAEGRAAQQCSAGWRSGGEACD